MTEAPGLTHHFAHLSEVDLHYVAAGSGAPVVLLHGWPQTWYEWRHIIPRLAETRTVIAPDMRGLGDTSRPLEGYDKMTVARDIVELMRDHLGHQRFAIIGHDWGGPVAFAAAVQAGDAITHFGLLDVVVPGLGGVDIAQGGQRWHHGFHRTPDLPEALVQGRERAYLSWFYRSFSHRKGAIEEADIDEYVRTYSKPGALRAGFSYYRASERDAADNAKAVADGFRLACPVLAIGGERADARGRGTEPAECLREVADNVTGIVAKDCGHFLVEEDPQLVSNAILALLER